MSVSYVTLTLFPFLYSSPFLDKIEMFFLKKVCIIPKYTYICTPSNEKGLGLVVQLVRIHACHAWGRGFESRPDRSKHKRKIKFPIVLI